MILSGSDLFIRMYKEGLTNGLMRELGDERWRTLCVLALCMDEDGYCFPSQEKIGEYLGIGRKAANARIKALLDFRFNGRPVLTLVGKDRGYTKRCNRYKVEPASQLAIFKGKTDSPEVSRREDISRTEDTYMSRTEDTYMSRTEDTYMSRGEDSYVSRTEDTNNNHINNNQSNNNKTPAELPFKESKGIIAYFCQKYRETYSVNYSPNYGRDVKLIQDKLIANYSMSQIKAILDVIFREYETRWKKDKYPRPSIGALSWLPNEALPIIQTEEKEQAEFKKAMDTSEIDLETALQRLERRLTE